MVHFALNVSRQNPPREERAPGTIPANAVAAYGAFARQLFATPTTIVTEGLVSDVVLTPSLDDIKFLRRKYYPDDMG
jgi:hypothetical protein